MPIATTPLKWRIRFRRLYPGIPAQRVASEPLRRTCPRSAIVSPTRDPPSNFPRHPLRPPGTTPWPRQPQAILPAWMHLVSVDTASSASVPKRNMVQYRVLLFRRHSGLRTRSLSTAPRTIGRRAGGVSGVRRRITCRAADCIRLIRILRNTGAPGTRLIGCPAGPCVRIRSRSRERSTCRSALVRLGSAALCRGASSRAATSGRAAAVVRIIVPRSRTASAECERAG
jgi:hypothetical protein